MKRGTRDKGQGTSKKNDNFRSAMMYIFLTLGIFAGCGDAKKGTMHAKPITLYLIPDWKENNSERDRLISSLPGKNTFFIYDSPMPEAAISDFKLNLPKNSSFKEMKYFSLLFIKASSGVPPLSLEWEKNEERPAGLLIAFIRGQLPKRSIAKAHERFSPDVYIFMKDHYEKMADVHSVPAYTAGTNTLSSPFTGDFPYLIKIEAGKGNVSVRPVDREGYILKPDAVTSKNISGLHMLKSLFDISLTVKEWETPFRHTSDITVPNPFQQTITLKVDVQQNARNTWQVNAEPSILNVKPGEKGILKATFLLEKVKEHKPYPAFTYSIYVGGEKVYEGKKEVKVKYYPKPEEGKP